MKQLLPNPSSYMARLSTRWPLLIGALSSLTLFSSCGNLPNETTPSVTSDRIIRSAYGNLEELFQTEVINIGLEQLGYTPISGSELEYDIIHQALGRNYLDYTAVHWNPLHRDFFEENGGHDTLKRLSPVVENALQGYLVDKATSTSKNINSIKDLADPEVATLFDTDGNGKANLVGCPHGWACRGVIESHLDDYNLRDTVEQDSHDYNASIGRTIQRYEAGEPVLYFTWTPLWVSSVLVPDEDAVWLDVPPLRPQKNQSVVNGKNLGFEINQIQILANRDLLKDNPDIERWFELVSIPITDVSLQNQRMRDGENTPESIRRHAEEWIQNNQGTFDSWLGEAKRFKK